MDMGTLDWVLGSATGLNVPGIDTFTGVLVNGVTTVWSNPFKLMASRSFGCAVVCTGTPVIQIQLEESFLDLKLGGYSLNGSSIYYVIPDAYPDVFSQINDTNWHLPSEPLTPIPMVQGRFKVNGLAGNGTTTTVAIVLFRQESGRFL